MNKPVEHVATSLYEFLKKIRFLALQCIKLIKQKNSCLFRQFEQSLSGWLELLQIANQEAAMKEKKP